MKKNSARHLFNFRTDLHSHVLPGVDDGSRNIEESVELLKGLSAMGLNRIYATPHVKSRSYANTRESLLPSYSQLCDRIRDESMDIELYLAAEYYMDDSFEAMIDGAEEMLTIADNHLLVETHMHQPPLFLFDLLFKIQSAGYKPILAHPERYTYYEGNPDKYRQLRNAGCLFQINLLSLSGFYGQKVREVVHMLIKENMVDFAGTDIHSPKQLPLLQDSKIFKWLKKADGISNDQLLSNGE